jgi:hypothetical protein
MKTPLLVSTALALVAATSFSPAMAQAPKPSGLASGTLEARDVSDQPGLRDILADFAAGRNVSARVSLLLQIGFFD